MAMQSALSKRPCGNGPIAARTTRAYLIEKGLIKHEARSSELRDDAALRLRYLGV